MKCHLCIYWTPETGCDHYGPEPVKSTPPVEVYLSKKTLKMYPLTADQTEIDLKNELSGIDLPKYKVKGENNAFTVYELKQRFR